MTFYRRRLVVLLALTAGACTKYAPAATLEPDAEAHVTLAPPQTVVLRIAGRDSLAEVGVAVLDGRIQLLTADSIVMRVWSARDARGASLNPPPGAVATVARGAGVTLAKRVPDERATRHLGYAVLGVSLLVLAALWMLNHMYDDEMT